MRKFKHDGKSVYLPSVRIPSLGFDKDSAAPGDLVLYREEHGGGTHGQRLARVIGRITWTDADGLDCVGHIVVLTADDTLSFGYVRWIRPESVVRCAPAERSREFAQFFLAAEPEALLAKALEG